MKNYVYRKLVCDHPLVENISDYGILQALGDYPHMQYAVSITMKDGVIHEFIEEPNDYKKVNEFLNNLPTT